MKRLSWASCALVATAAIASAVPAFAQSNLSDITGPNVSDITGPNVSDITGPNTSDITGTDAASDAARRAVSAGLDKDGIEQLADDLGAAYKVCAAGGDCSAFNRLYEQITNILY